MNSSMNTAVVWNKTNKGAIIGLSANIIMLSSHLNNKQIEQVEETLRVADRQCIRFYLENHGDEEFKRLPPSDDPYF